MKKLYVTIPVMDEVDFLYKTLSSIGKQTYKNFEVIINVNQPDSWWEDHIKIEICENNSDTLKLLKDFKEKAEYKLHIIDKSSKGNGFTDKESGVGWARKIMMDYIAENISEDEDDIIVSLDADTEFDKRYFQSIVDTFSAKSNKKAIAMANPYYHRLTGEGISDRAVLRYEIYMRNYVSNLLRIGCPYSFTALGSAIVLPVKSYKKINGIVPKKSGEDFYFLQKLRKSGRIIIYNSEKVYPASRFSDRVPFGTGPAMAKGVVGDWDSYPIYHYSLFDKIGETYNLFDKIYNEDIETPTPMSDFFKTQFKEENIFIPLKKNSVTLNQFIRACHEKIDALRVLQFLRIEHQKILESEDKEHIGSKNVFDFLVHFYGKVEVKKRLPHLFEELGEENIDPYKMNPNISFEDGKITNIDKVRNFMMDKELEIKKEKYFLKY